MVSKPRTLKRLIPVLALALMASFALGAANASALSVSPEGNYFIGSGGEVWVTKAGTSGHKFNCTSALTPGRMPAPGEIRLTLEGCSYEGAPCYSPGQPSGRIETPILTTKLVYLDAAKTKFGLMLSPPASGVFAEFDCYFGQGHFVWTGNLIGQITSPALNVSTKKTVLLFGPSTPGVQYDQQIEGAGPKYHLNETRSFPWIGKGSETYEVALKLTTNLETAVNVKFIP